MSLVELNWPLNKFYFDLNESYFISRGECYLLQPTLSEFDVLHCSIILIPIWTEHSAVLLCHFDVYSMNISKLILAKFSLTSHLSHNSQNFGILLNNCVLWSWFLFAIVLCVCARACVWGWACVSVFCMPVLYAVCSMGVDVSCFIILCYL